MNRPALNALLIRQAVQSALQEDLGLAGDVTSQATIPATARAIAILNVRESGVVCGLDVARAAFQALDPEIAFEAMVEDGERVSPRTDLVRIEGSARSILGAERVALNFLCHMSGVASLTARYADAIAHTNARIVCTRKTLPGLRAFEKYAARSGGRARTIDTGWTTPS